MLIDSNDFIQFCENEKQKSEIRMQKFLRSDGIAKKGCAIGVMGSGDAIRGYEHSIENMIRYCKEKEENNEN